MARDFNQNRIANAKLVSADIDKFGKTFAIQSPYNADGFSSVNVTVEQAPSNIKQYLEGNNSITVYPVPSNIDKLCVGALMSFPNIEDLYLFKTSAIVVLEDDLSYLLDLNKIYVPTDLLSAYQSAYPTIASKFDIIVEDYTLTIPFVGDTTLTSEYVDSVIAMLSNAEKNAITKVVIPTDFTQESAINIYFDYNFSALPNLNENVWWGTIEHCIDSVLNNNSPSSIREVIRKGQALTYWNIGDEIEITLTDNTTITMRLVDGKIGRYNIKDSNEKSNAVFMVTKIYWSYQMNSSGNNDGGWAASQMCTTKMVDLLALFPDAWKSVISQVSISSATSGSDSTLTSGYTKLFIPNTYEIFGNTSGSYSTEQVDQFGWYVGKSASDRIMKDTNNNSTDWWLRSPLAGNSNRFVIVNIYGNSHNYNANVTIGVALCFAI